MSSLARAGTALSLAGRALAGTLALAGRTPTGRSLKVGTAPLASGRSRRISCYINLLNDTHHSMQSSVSYTV